MIRRIKVKIASILFILLAACGASSAQQSLSGVFSVKNQLRLENQENSTFEAKPTK